MVPLRPATGVHKFYQLALLQAESATRAWRWVSTSALVPKLWTGSLCSHDLSWYLSLQHHEVVEFFLSSLNTGVQRLPTQMATYLINCPYIRDSFHFELCMLKDQFAELRVLQVKGPSLSFADDACRNVDWQYMLCICPLLLAACGVDAKAQLLLRHDAWPIRAARHCGAAPAVCLLATLPRPLKKVLPRWPWLWLPPWPSSQRP